jgi:hypothetical protein
MASGKTLFQSNPESIQEVHLQLIDSAMAVSRPSDNDDPFEDIIAKNFDVIDMILQLLVLPDKTFDDQV